MEEIEEKVFMTKKKFSMMVEYAVLEDGVGYMDAIITLCDENNMEIEDAKKFLLPSVISKLEVEAIRLNHLKPVLEYEPLE